MTTTETKTDFLRPSMLPKLALCGHYRSDVAGAAADRGTRLDVAFRDSIARKNIDVSGFDSEEREAIKWASATARALSGDWPLESDENWLKIECMGMTGTADLLCVGAGWSADLKTGQRRNYVEQQAAYALGFMDLYFADEWTVYLLYCDLRELETLRFTRKDAEKLVRGALTSARGEEPPVVNDYCGWCVKRFTCPARRESLGIIESDVMKLDLLDKLASPALREFVLRAKTVEEFAERARDILLDRTIAGEKTPGVAISSRKGSRKIEADELFPLIVEGGAPKIHEILTTCGTLSEAKAIDLWAGSALAFPADKVIELPGSSFVRISTPKPAKEVK